MPDLHVHDLRQDLLEALMAAVAVGPEVLGAGHGHELAGERSQAIVGLPRVGRRQQVQPRDAGGRRGR